MQTARSLAEGSAAVVSVGADSVDAANDGKLVHVSGPVTARRWPADPDFGIRRKGCGCRATSRCISGRKSSKSETKTKLGGGEETVTTYSYSKGWDDSQITRPTSRSRTATRIRRWRSTADLPDPGGQARRLHARHAGARRIDGDKDLSLSPDQAAAIDAAYTGTQEGQRRRRPDLSRPEHDIAGARRLPHRLRVGAARRDQHRRRARTAASSSPTRRWPAMRC